MSEGKELGFTGTRERLTSWQTVMVEYLLSYHFAIGYGVFHHGDCIGADDYAARKAFDLGYIVISHPPDITTYRAYTPCHLSYPVAPYHVRNDAIVAAANVAIGTPNTRAPRPYSGTWSTMTKLSRARIPYWVVAPDSCWPVVPITEHKVAPS